MDVNTRIMKLLDGGFVKARHFNDKVGNWRCDSYTAYVLDQGTPDNKHVYDH